MVELTWGGKHKKARKMGKYVRSNPMRRAYVFKTIRTFGVVEGGAWCNRLIQGDKSAVLPSLLEEFAGKANLIYIDPPFNTGKVFKVGDNLCYDDRWDSLDSYLQWFYETAVLLRDLLADDGSMYVHLDEHVSHYAKVLLDEIFSQENFVNEIIWRRVTAHGARKGCGRIHDVILWYAKTPDYFFGQSEQPLRKE